MIWKAALWPLAVQTVIAATIPFEGLVAGNISVLSPGPVIENSATGVANLLPFGSGEYVKHGFMDFEN